MDKKQLWQFHRQGMRPAKIAAKMNLSRKEVEKAIKEIADAKKKQRHYITISLTICVILALIIVGLVVRQRTSNKDNGVKSPIALDKYIGQDLIRAYLAGRELDQWLVTKEAIEGSQAKTLLPAQENTIRKLEAIFSSNTNLPAVAQLKKVFSGHFYVSFYTDKFGGTSVNISSGPQKPKRDPQMIEIVLYSEADHYRTERTDTLAKYDLNWHALILAGLDMTPAWFQAITAHELLHALRDREHAITVHQPMLSDLWIREELEAHGLERQILNNATRGGYLHALLQIAGSKKNAADLETFFFSITPQDLAGLDQLFPRAAKYEAQDRFAQYLFDLGDLWLTTRSNGPVPEKQRIANYRLLAKIFIRPH